MHPCKSNMQAQEQTEALLEAYRYWLEQGLASAEAAHIVGIADPEAVPVDSEDD